jgi:poly(A) polymerase
MTSQRDKAVAIVKRLRQEGFESYLAGGCVRDLLLNKAPQDYDIATSARPEDVQRIFPRTIPVGAQFGVILVMLDGHSFEVASFRFDGPYIDGRRPSQVRYGTLQEDIFRRDFTINGLVYDPIEDRLIDLIGGKKDLERRCIRAIGNPRERFDEDRLRMVRAIRFAASLNFEIDSATMDAIKQSAATITQISWERIGEEITRILTEGGARRGFELLDETGILKVVLPEIEQMKGVEQGSEHHPEGDVFKHTLLTLSHLEAPSESLAYGCLLHDIAKPVCFRKEYDRITFYGHTDHGAEMAEAVLKRLKRGRATWERVAYLVKNHLRHTQAPKMRLSTLKRFLREDGIHELLELARIDALSSSGDLQYHRFCQERLAEMQEEEIRPEPLLRGKDLIEMGYIPGPIFAEILQRVEDAQLGGELTGRQQAIDWVKQNYRG